MSWARRGFLLTLEAWLWLAGGCQTAEAVAALPESYWIATEGLLLAFLADLWSLVRLFF